MKSFIRYGIVILGLLFQFIGVVIELFNKSNISLIIYIIGVALFILGLILYAILSWKEN